MERATTIGFIGLGQMGGTMVATLLRTFSDVVVFDIDPERVERTVAAGAAAADDAESLVRSCPTVMLSLPASHVTIEVLEQQVLPAVPEGTTVIDLGTTLAEETRRLARLFNEKGADLVDAPVSGGPVGSAKGALYVFAGGDREAVRRAWPVLSTLGSGGRVTWCGPSGAGQVTKGVNQLAMGLLSAACMEAVGYGVAGGVDPAVLLQAVGGSGGFRAQFEGVASRIVSGLGDTMDHKAAEFDYFLDEADRTGFAAPMLRGLADLVKDVPKSSRDNMNRPFSPFWSTMMDQKDGGS